MADNKQITRTNPRRPDCVTEIRMGNSVLVVSGYFKQDSTRNCHRQNGKSAASRSRCYTEADLSGMSRGHGKSGHALTWPLSRWVNTQLSDMGILSTKCFDLFFELLLPLLQQRTHLSLYCFQR